MDQNMCKQAPIVILSHPQMGENIGAAARVMRNFGLHELRLIAPRDGWPNEKATAMAAGAFAGMKPVRVFADTQTALGDLQQVFAVTARLRDMEKPVFHPSKAMDILSETQQNGGVTGLLFGAEASGLTNQEVSMCDGIVTYPIAADFSSLNLAQAIAVAAYAWTNASDGLQPYEKKARSLDNPLASKREIEGMLAHLEAELEAAGFFFPVEKQAVMMQNLGNLFARVHLSAQEVRTLRGVIKALSKGRGRKTNNK